MKPLVSILIPAYNAEKWIAETIHSALEQTWESKEIIVVVDGCTDRTLSIVRHFESRGVQVVDQANEGGPAARNTAFSLSRGEYIQWLDHDDLLAPDKISKQMALVCGGCSRRTLLSCAWGRFMYRRGRAKFVPSGLWSDLAPAEFLLRKLEQKAFMQTAVWLVSRELTLAAGPWDTTMLTDDDGEYFCRLLLASDGVKFVPDARIYFRSSGYSQASFAGRSNQKLDALWGSIQLHLRYLLSLEDSERSRAACLKHLQDYVIDFYPQRPDILSQMKRTAEDLGGRLQPPNLSWKYAWIKTLFGWNWATRAQVFTPNVRWSLVRWWDKVSYEIEKKRLAGGFQM